MYMVTKDTILGMMNLQAEAWVYIFTIDYG